MKQRPQRCGGDATWLAEAGTVLKGGAEGQMASEPGTWLAFSGHSKEGGVAGVSGAGEG